MKDRFGTLVEINQLTGIQSDDTLYRIASINNASGMVTLKIQDRNSSLTKKVCHSKLEIFNPNFDNLGMTLLAAGDNLLNLTPTGKFIRSNNELFALIAVCKTEDEVNEQLRRDKDFSLLTSSDDGNLFWVVQTTPVRLSQQNS